MRSTAAASVFWSHHQVDCSCFYTSGPFFSNLVQRHFTFASLARQPLELDTSDTEYLGQLSSDQRAALLEELDAEVLRRQAHTRNAAERKENIARQYQPRHPELWTLQQEMLRPEFIELVQQAKRGVTPNLSQAWRGSGVSKLPIFSARFCELMCDELDAFAESQLPIGRPNAMNRFRGNSSRGGLLLDELGLSPCFLDPLVCEYLTPLCTAIPLFASMGAATISHHKAFVVAYHEGEDRDSGLKVHTDNAEITLNVSLGPLKPSGELAFNDGQLVFYGKEDEKRSQVEGHHEWTEEAVGHGVLHLGRHYHGANPITEGERRNLIIWMRSFDHRMANGCPMCGRSDQLINGSP